MEETTLELRRIKLSLNYWSKLRSFNCKNPARSLLEEHWEFQRRGGRERKGSMINSVDKRAQDMNMKDYIITSSAARNRMFSDMLKFGVSSLSLKSILENKKYDATKVVISFLLHTGLYLRI